ncbi:hypothetical protein [Apibacter mensalis]|uniref:hypothetical protein n=1 Tax=Apibacter mensalis TaxID=1586267 RepID=UPI0026F19BD7|nr:hypothetical protein [Apibacter mensalis]
MKSKILNFHLYRFHLLPLKTNTQAYNEHFDEKLTLEELKNKKNEIFKEILLKLNTTTDKNKNPIQIYDKTDNDECFLYKIANKKTTTITKNFKHTRTEDEPYVFIIINNNKEIQKIAINENSKAFTNPDSVRNIIKKLFQKDLEKYGINIEIEKLFDKKTFWNYASKYKDQISFINFKIIKPNLANISASLSEDLKKFMNKVNSHESNLKIKAPKKGVLENINQSNPDINGLVDYSSKGGGSVTLKVKGIIKSYNTLEKPEIIEIDEMQIEGSPEEVNKVFATIVQ